MNQTPIALVQRTNLRLNFLAISGLFLVLAIVRFSYNLKALGLVEEWDLFSVLQSGTGLLDFTHKVFTTRPILMLATGLGYWLTPNSFVGLNFLLLSFILMTAVFCYSLLCRLLPEQPLIAFFTAALVMVYPSDTGLIQLRSFSIHLAVLALLLATYFLVAYWQRPHRSRLILMWIAMGVSLATYEIGYPLAVVIPVVLVWLNRGLSRRVLQVAGQWYIGLAVAIFIAFVAQRSIPASYIGGLAQTSVATMDTWTNVRSMIFNTFRMYQRNFFGGWRDALGAVLSGGASISYGIAAALVVGLTGWLFSQTDKSAPGRLSTTRLSTLEQRKPFPSYLLIIIASVIAFGIGISPYILSVWHRLINDRVYYYALIFAAFALMVTLYLISRLFAFGRAAYILVSAALVGAAVVSVVEQVQMEVNYNKIQDRLLGGIVQAAPSIKDDTLVVVLDETGLYQSTFWLFNQSNRFTLALQSVYSDPRITASICYPDEIAWGEEQESCKFLENGFLLHSSVNPGRLYPYNKVVVFRMNIAQQVSVLEQIPNTYLPNMVTIQNYAPRQLLDVSAPPPPNVHRLLLQWPVEPLPPPAIVHQVRFEFDRPVNGVGWSPPVVFDEQGSSGSFMWTMLPHATFNVRLAADDYMLQMRVLGSLTPDIAASLTLQVNNQPILLQSHADAGGALIFSGKIPRAVIEGDLLNTRFTFHTNKVISPKSIGMNEDTRMFGVQFNWLDIQPLPAPVHQVRFGFDQLQTEPGWELPEKFQDVKNGRNTFMWTNAMNAALNFRLLPDDYTLQMRVLGSLTPDIAASLTLQVNEQPIPLSTTIDTDGALLFSGKIPRAVIEGDLLNTRLTFHTDKVISPKSIGMNDDGRTLGVKLNWLDIEPQLAITSTASAAPPASTPTPVMPASAHQAHIEFDQPINGVGWWDPEISKLSDGEHSTMWTKSTEATLNLNLVADNYTLRIRILNSLAPDIAASLTLHINAQSIPLSANTDAYGGTILSGKIPRDVIAHDPLNTLFSFHTNRVITPKSLGMNADERTLGVMFDWLDVQPQATSQPS